MQQAEPSTCRGRSMLTAEGCAGLDCSALCSMLMFYQEQKPNLISFSEDFFLTLGMKSEEMPNSKKQKLNKNI